MRSTQVLHAFGYITELPCIADGKYEPRVWRWDLPSLARDEPNHHLTNEPPLRLNDFFPNSATRSGR
jgi:hypothetical protein